MAFPGRTRIGQGRSAIVLTSRAILGDNIEVSFRTDDIHEPTDWRISASRHTLILHLGGCMDRLETEMDGLGGSYGPAVPGEVWTVPAGCAYASHAQGSAIRYALIHLEPGCTPAVMAAAARRDAALMEAVRRLEPLVEGGDDTTCMMAQDCLQQLITHISIRYAENPTAGRPPAAGPALRRETVRELREFVHEHAGERITLGQLASLAGMGVHAFLEAFRRAFATTPANYVIQQRLRRVQVALARSRQDITTIALDNGFCSHSHLTATFARHLGMPPSRFREEARAGAWWEN